MYSVLLRSRTTVKSNVRSCGFLLFDLVLRGKASYTYGVSQEATPTPCPIFRGGSITAKWCRLLYSTRLHQGLVQFCTARPSYRIVHVSTATKQRQGCDFAWLVLVSKEGRFRYIAYTRKPGQGRVPIELELPTTTKS